MTPELPIEIPPGAKLIAFAYPELECSMLHNEVRCRNHADTAIIYPTNIGYSLLAYCQHCFDTRGDGWIEALEATIRDY